MKYVNTQEKVVIKCGMEEKTVTLEHAIAEARQGTAQEVWLLDDSGGRAVDLLHSHGRWTTKYHVAGRKRLKFYAALAEMVLSQMEH